MFHIALNVSGLLSNHGRREASKIMRVGWIALGNYWLDKIRPRHFTAKGAAMYRYEPRSAAYVARKLKQRGHNDPLRWTGRSQARSALGQVKATGRGVRVTMNVPQLNMKPRGKRDSMRDELTRVLTGEKRELGRVWVTVVTDLMNKLSGRGRQRLAG